MKVTLLTEMDNDWLTRMYIGARTCYSVKALEDDSPNEAKINLLKKVFKSGHLSVAEHATLSFYLRDISRACSHQLVRHRLCSFSQQSQRYVKYKDGMNVYVPDAILNKPEALEIFKNVMITVSDAYEKLMEEYNIKAEDARYVFTNATCTDITITLNLREMMHLCNERLCTRAQKEIRDLVREMAQQVIEKQEWLADFLCPKCSMLGYCPEEKGCGRKPSLERLSQKGIE